MANGESNENNNSFIDLSWNTSGILVTNLFDVFLEKACMVYENSNIL